MFSPAGFRKFCRDVCFLNVTNARTQMFLPFLKQFQMGEGLCLWCRGPVWTLHFYLVCQNSPFIGWFIPFPKLWFQSFGRKHGQNASDLLCTAACVDGFICITFNIVKWRWRKPQSAVKEKAKISQGLSRDTHTRKGKVKCFNLFTSACQM